MSEATVDLVCPRCESPNPHPASAAVTIVDCVGCDRSFAVGPLGEGTSTAARATDLSVAPTEVGLARSGGIGLAFTAVFYLALVYPLRGTYFGDLFGDRGWVPYAIALMSAWAGVILVAKYSLLQRQLRAFERDLLPEALGVRIEPDRAEGFVAHLRGSEGLERSFLVARLVRALQHFRARGSVQEVVDQLGQQAQSDIDAVDASYTLVRTFIWAIPILGFIGTVLGIGAAVSGFSDSVSGAVDLGVMKQSIGSVTTGLGIAFDTTLLALVMSILVMFPASWLQKAERGFLSRVDTYCDEHLLRRLVQDSRPGTPAADGGLAGGLGDLRREFERLTETIAQLDERLSRIGRS